MAITQATRYAPSTAEMISIRLFSPKGTPEECNVVGHSPSGAQSEESILRVGVRDYSKWLQLVVITALFVSGVIQRGGLSMSLRGLLWLITVILTNTSLALLAVRTGRGLTLNTDGITWHGSEIYLPWSKVKQLEVVSTDTKTRLVVKTSDPAHALDGQRGRAKISIHANEQRFGGPVAVVVDQLTIPADQIIATAERLKHQHATVGDPGAPTSDPTWAQHQRALRTMNVWTTLGFAALLAGLAITFLW